MNISYEFSKIRDSFSKVRKDMTFLSDKISENYEEFTKEHEKLANAVHKLSNDIENQLHVAKTHVVHKEEGVSPKELLDLKTEVKELKKELIAMQRDHEHFTRTLDDVKRNSSESADVKELREKLKSSELELFLLKERMIEKDVEVKQLKDVSQRLFDIVDELSKTELELLNKTK